jgi:Tripartite tricarboxylate transporter TctB family
VNTEQSEPTHNARDITFGILLIVLSILGLYFNQEYELGSASRMGPGYMPMLVLGLLGIFGVGLLITGARNGPDPLENWAWRELGLVLSAMTVFGAFLQLLGLALSVGALVMISSFADRSQTLKGALGLSAIMIVLCWFVFNLGLNLGIPFLPPALG